MFHVLAFVKIAFSTDGLNKFKEADCANKEAFKYVFPLRFASFSAHMCLVPHYTACTCGGVIVSHPTDKLFDSQRYQKSPASFEALARQSAMLSQSDSALFDSDHPSLAGKVLDGITFKELTQEQLDQVREKCGLQKV